VSLSTRRENLHWPAVPRGTVNDRLSVGRESCRRDASPLVSQPLELELGVRPTREDAAGGQAEGGSEDERGSRREEPSAPLQASRLGGGDSPRDGSLREVVARTREVVREVFGRGVAFLRVLGKTAFDDPANGGGRLRVDLPDGLRLFAQDRDERLGARLALEGTLSRHHLVEDRAEGELVGTEVERLAARLLGRHVAGRAHDRAGLGRRRHGGRHDRQVRRSGLDQLGEAKVEDLDEPVLRDHEVLGFQIPVNNPRGVGLGESVGHLCADLEELAGGHRLLDDEVPQRPPLDDLHRDVDHSVRGADVVDSYDVGVVQRRGRARLLLEALAPLRIQRNLGGKDLDRDFASEPGVPGPIHLTHPTRAERRENLIGTEPRSSPDHKSPITNLSVLSRLSAPPAN
jgi:hypothetical protein